MARYSEEERDTHLELWRESGLSKQAYSKASGLNYKTFLKWSKPSIGSSLASRSKKKGDFISVSLPESAVVSPEFIEISYPSGVLVKLPMGISVSILKTLLG